VAKDSIFMLLSTPYGASSCSIRRCV